MTGIDVATPVAGSLAIVDTTLHEGEQFAGAHFTGEQRLALSCQLDAFEVDMLEVPSPRLSPQTARDVAAIAALGLRAQAASAGGVLPGGGESAKTTRAKVEANPRFGRITSFSCALRL